MRVVVKFHPDARPPHSPDRGKAVAGPDWENLAALFPGIVWEPYFAGIHPAVLRKFDRLKPAFGTEPFAFETYYVVDNAANHDRDKIARELKKWKGVQTAYAEPGLAPPPSTVDPLNAAQGYQDDAPRGIGSRSFSANTGIAGADIGFIG